MSPRVAYENTPCILWQGVIDPQGYARRGGKLLHRSEYKRLVGPIPEGLVIDHLCRNRSCINVEHMEPVPQAENLRRGLLGVLLTQCRHGHAYTEENTYYNAKGHRRCRACNRERQREFKYYEVYRARKRAATEGAS